MNKEKFLETLRKKLAILEESEIEDILTEYEGYIEEKIAQGSTEEKAVKSMGDVDELAKELLSAYKIKTDNKYSDMINDFVSSANTVIDNIASTFAEKSFNEIVRFMFEFAFIILVVFTLVRIPFIIIEIVVKGILSSILSSLGIGWKFHFVTVIFRLIFTIIYVVCAVLLSVKVLKDRYSKLEGNFSTKKKEQVVKSESSKDTTKNEIHDFGIASLLAKMCILFVKFIFFWVLLGVACYVMGMSVMLGLVGYFLIKGVTYYGFYILIFSLFLLGVISFVGLFNFIFNHKTNKGLLLASTLISLVLLGIGAGMSAFEAASTTVLYKEEITNKKTEEKIITMRDNLVLEGKYLNNDITIDNTLENQIKVVYEYSDKYLKIEPKIYEQSSGEYNILYIDYNVSNFEYSKDMFYEAVENLKNKKIIVTGYDAVNVKIYMSSATKEMLDSNWQKNYALNKNRNGMYYNHDTDNHYGYHSVFD